MFFFMYFNPSVLKAPSKRKFLKISVYAKTQKCFETAHEHASQLGDNIILWNCSCEYALLCVVLRNDMK